jgi:hypothetical protein
MMTQVTERHLFVLEKLIGRLFILCSEFDSEPFVVGDLRLIKDRSVEATFTPLTATKPRKTKFRFTHLKDTKYILVEENPRPGVLSKTGLAEHVSKIINGE